MDKVLFIVAQDINVNAQINGGSLCALRNYEAICNYFGKEQVEIFQLQDCDTISFWKRIFRKLHFILFYRFYRLYAQSEKQILKIAAEKNLVFIDSSLYGRLAKFLKKKYPQIRIVSFFHNIEYEYAKKEYPFGPFYHYVVFRNEILACRYSDAIIVLNQRDVGLIKRYYGCNADAIIPISFSDKHPKFTAAGISNVPVGLFQGSNFFANIHGIKWFIEKVLPFVNMKLMIVGKDMDKADLPKSEKMEVLGYVENIDSVIQNADFMIYPIFQGSGMKVKTCEALMYGKNIIGTREAFEGYDVDFEKVGACCGTAEEFIKIINEFPKKFSCKFNDYSRSVFLEKYSNDVTFKQFAEVFV